MMRRLVIPVLLVAAAMTLSGCAPTATAWDAPATDRDNVPIEFVADVELDSETVRFVDEVDGHLVYIAQTRDRSNCILVHQGTTVSADGWSSGCSTAGWVTLSIGTLREIRFHPEGLSTLDDDWERLSDYVAIAR